MKAGGSLETVLGEVMRQAESKSDYVADTKVVSLVTTNNSVALKLDDKGEFNVTNVAHGQIAEHVKIPKQYYDRMLNEAPDLLATNVDRWFQKYPAPRLIRTLDGKARAFLSNGYRTLDNFDFAQAIMPVIRRRNLTVMSAQITETRLYIKAVDEQLFRDVPIGYKMGDGSHKIFDTCAPAIILANSEVGFGRLVLDTGVYTKACTNLALFSDGGMKRTHLGARHKLTDAVENIDHLLSERTKQKTDEALWLQVRDVVEAAFDQGKLAKRVEQLTATAENRITGKVEKVVEVAAKKLDLSDKERELVLKNLIEGANLSQYGLHAAITRASQDVEDYDRVTELEYAGGKVIELPKTEWQEIATAA